MAKIRQSGRVGRGLEKHNRRASRAPIAICLIRSSGLRAAAAADERNIAQRVRRACRDAFHAQRILERIVPDMYAVLGLSTPQVRYRVHARTRTSEGGE